MTYKKSSFLGLPVGTGLAMETLAVPSTDRVDNDRAIPKPHSLQNVSFIGFDIFTLVRDLISAVDTDDLKSITVEKTIIAVGNICNYVGSINEIYGLALFYNTFELRPKDTIPLTVETIGGRRRKMVIDTMIEIGRKHCKKLPSDGNDVALIEMKLVKHNDTMLLYSHHVHYLATLMHMHKPIMLESHTGKIIVKDDLSCKYKSNVKLNKEDYPLHPDLLTIFGDGYDIQHSNAKVIELFNELWSKNRMQKTSPYGKVKFLAQKFIKQNGI